MILYAKLAGMSAGKKQNEKALLAATVQSVLATAAAKGMDSVAMPLIGTGVAGWPKQLAAEVCLAEVLIFLRAAPSSLKVSRDALLPTCCCVYFDKLQQPRAAVRPKPQDLLVSS